MKFIENFKSEKMDTKIVLIVGPSGAGKDTLIKESKKYLEDVNFVDRYITRKPDFNEANFYLDEYAFELLKHNSFFISSWQAHENFYGISKNSIKNALNIISISRTKVRDFEKLYENVYTINITVPKDVLEKRLNKRNREDKKERVSRLNRNIQNIESSNLIEFDNSANIEESLAKFLKLIENIAQNKV